MKLSGLVPMQALGMTTRKPVNAIKESEMDVVPTEKDSNVANGLPQTQGDDKITLSKEHFKNIVREVMKEESEYQRIFQKMLSKFGVNSPADLNDEQKKKFFTLVKGIQTELKERMKIKEAELSGGQKKLDIDKDGDIGGDDLAKLRASKNESKKKK
jgi:predicted flavoprotein YhiN